MVIGLWSDLKTLTKAEFEREVDRIQRELEALAARPSITAAPATKKGKKRSVPKDDKPVTRITHILRSQLALTEDAAAATLSDSLRERGIPGDRIPPVGAIAFDSWLERLLGQVSASVVMDAAIELGSTRRIS